jgi:short-subunit dehydrogenase
VGRDSAKLTDVARRCAAAAPTTSVADFSARGRNEALVRDVIDALGGDVDAVLIAHGDLGDQLASERSFTEADAIVRTNFTSVVELLLPLANHMEGARHGTLGVITSVAGDRGRPRNYTYGASKGALSIYLQGLRTRLYASGVKVTNLKLGPVDTPMTKGHAKHALFGKPPGVARGIVDAMDRGAPVAYVPSVWAAIMPIIRNTPERVFQALPFLSGR